MKIFTLDPGATTGFAFFDTSKPESSIEHGSVKLAGEGEWEKAESIQKEIPPLLKHHDPDIVVIEQPLPFIKTYQKTDMIGRSGRTVNPKSTITQSHMAGALQMCALQMNYPWHCVLPKVWQQIIPASITGIKDDGTNPKEDRQKRRVKWFCQMLKIVGGNEHSRDAAIMAVWARGHCQTLKMLERAVPA